jgi:hypothetical protein
LSQTEARKEVGISRSSAWRYDEVFKVEEAARTAALEACNKRRDERLGEQRATNGEAVEGVEVVEADDDVWADTATTSSFDSQGPAMYPVPSWDDRPPKESPVEVFNAEGVDESTPVGLFERRRRAQSAGPRPLPDRHPSLNPRAVSTLMGPMPESEGMAGTMAKPFLPEDAPSILEGVVPRWV